MPGSYVRFLEDCEIIERNKRINSKIKRAVKISEYAHAILGRRDVIELSWVLANLTKRISDTEFRLIYHDFKQQFKYFWYPGLMEHLLKECETAYRIDDLIDEINKILTENGQDSYKEKEK